MDLIFVFTAFFAGIVSFLAPCVLPIVPGFLAYLAGSTDKDSKTVRRDVFVNSVFFVLGFSLVFALLGILLETVLSSVGAEVQGWLSRLGGIIIIFFGLYLTGLIKLSFLEQDRKIRVTKKFSSRYLTSFVFGTAFAVGWTACAGAVLGSILGLAASSPVSAFFLLLTYALGLGVPFLLVGLFTGQAATLIEKYGGKVGFINIIFGGLLVIIGILIFTESLSVFGNFDFINRLFLERSV
ncbi:MAG: cytochrome c biogenesis protein CcdA [Patescibacteria group bacterium]